MMSLIAAAVAAAQPAAPTPANMQAQHQQHQMHPGNSAEHKGMDCCKTCCCKDMAKKEHGGRAGHHGGHADQSSAH